MNPREKFPEFYGNPTIQDLAGHRRWSVSTASKKPIDMGWLLHGSKSAQYMGSDIEPPGARVTDPSTMATLDELTDALPDARNCAYYLNAERDGIVILDVEPHADDRTKLRALALDALYKEVSMSGQGYHLVFPYPATLFDKYPDARKPVLKRKDGAYELHLVHWVTFTRNVDPVKLRMDDVTVGEGSGSHDGGDPFANKGVKRHHVTSKRSGDGPSKLLPTSFEGFIEPLLRAQKPVARLAEVDVDAELDAAQLALVDEIAADPATRLVRGPSAYDGDLSRYEFAYVAHINHVVHHAVSPIAVPESLGIPGDVIHRMVEATPSEEAVMTYEVARRLVPYRSKHDETRCGMPWLLYTVKNVMERG